MPDLRIEPYTEEHRVSILSVWERSVLATHHFLDSTDFYAIKKLLHEFDFTALHVYCLNRDQETIGFIGLSGKKIDMLFLSPDYLRMGLGKKLLNFAISECSADQVDVNEQNTDAVQFYRKMGFESVERTEKDDLGKGYPLLRMRRRAVNDY